MKMKDQQLTEPMVCQDCGKTCNGIQGIRGHRRSCPGRKSHYSVSGPGSELVEPGKSDEVVRAAERVMLGSRLGQRGVEVIMQLIEGIDIQLTDLAEQLDIRKVMDSVARERKWTTYDKWERLTLDVYQLKSSLEEIVRQAYVSRDEPLELYQLAISIKKRWVYWRREEAYRSWQKQPEEAQQDFDVVLEHFGVPELEASWSRIIDGLRWLTSHTKATLQ
jgi:hypothetical protein